MPNTLGKQVKDMLMSPKNVKILGVNQKLWHLKVGGMSQPSLKYDGNSEWEF